MVDRLPHDAKSVIASFLSGQQLKQLVLVNRAWRAAADSHLMSRIHVPPRTECYDLFGESEGDSWAGIRQLLESQPSRIPSIKEITAVMINDTMGDRNAILRRVSPYLTKWTEAYCCPDHSPHACCDWAGQSHLTLAMQPMPVLKNLTIHVDGAWSLTLPNLFRMTPNLTSLCLRGEITDTVGLLPMDMWLRLDKLTTLSVEHDRRSLASTLLSTLVPLCDNLRTFNLKLLSLTWDDLRIFKNYIHPIRTARHIENVSIDWPDGDEDNIMYCEELFSEKRYDEALKWLGMKRLNVTSDYVEPFAAPMVASIETFRITTKVQLKDQKYTEEISCGRAVSNVGNLPSRTTTGGLGEDTLQTIMDFVPSLTLFEAAYNAPPGPFPPTEPPEVLQFLNVQTFVNCANALIHCWTTADCSLFRFGPHQSWYHLHAQLDPKLYLPEDGAIEHGYNFSPYNVPERVDPCSSVVVSSTGVTGPFEFTHYRGWQLPFVLLDYVYSQIDVERLPTRGQRGLCLPSHVWRVLDGWYDEVESLIKREVDKASA